MPTYSAIHVNGVDYSSILSTLTRTLEPGGYERGDPNAPVTSTTNVFFISPEIDGWVTLLPSNSLDGREFFWAELLSQGNGSAIWLYRYEDDFIMYRLYRAGQLQDRYHSGQANADGLARGNPRALKPYLVAGATIEDADGVLRPEQVTMLPVEERFRALARLLGISTAETSADIALAQGTLALPDGEAWDRVVFNYSGAT